MANPTPRWPGPEYHVRTELPAPLDYAFAWCTDFDPHDDRREQDRYSRKIIERSPRRVVFEDLTDSPEGWNWARHVVTLRPPDRWHSDSVGSHRDLTIDYQLTPLSAEQTRLDFRWKRRRTGLGKSPPSKRAIEQSSTAAWQHFARELGKDYRKSVARRGH